MHNLFLLQTYEIKSLIKELLKSSNLSKGLLSIIDVSLLELYPKFVHSKQITIDDLQQFDLWPKVFSCFGMDANL